MAVVEIRCPVGPRRLLSKVIATGDSAHVVDGNLIEFACTDCARSLRRRGEDAGRVLHRFNLAGELVESQVVPTDDL